jgi:hypothetical protein
VSENPVEAEYILMEEACGTSLSDVWKDLKIHSKDKIVKDIVTIELELLSVSFSRSASQDTTWKTTNTVRYGNIYFAKDSFPGCEKAEVSGDISEENKKLVEERFVIGPVVEDIFWRSDQPSMPMDRGPCRRPTIG